MFHSSELKIPFVKEFIFFYVSAYLAFLPPFLSFDLDKHVQISKSLIFSGLLGGVIFLTYPTGLGFEREIIDAGYLQFIFDYIWRQDYPVTLMPSFHVAMSFIFISPMINFKNPGPMSFIYCGWLILISISIVFVHQHHLIDIPTGIILGWLSLKLNSRKEI